MAFQDDTRSSIKDFNHYMSLGFQVDEVGFRVTIVKSTAPRWFDGSS